MEDIGERRHQDPSEQFPGFRCWRGRMCRSELKSDLRLFGPCKQTRRVRLASSARKNRVHCYPNSCACVSPIMVHYEYSKPSSADVILCFEMSLQAIPEQNMFDRRKCYIIQNHGVSLLESFIRKIQTSRTRTAKAIAPCRFRV